MKDEDLKEFATLGLDQEVQAPAHMKQGWHDSIDAAARRELAGLQKTSHAFKTPFFVWGAALTTALTIGIAIGITLHRVTPDIDRGQQVVAVVPGAESDNAAAFARVLQVHLRDTQDSLASLPDRGAEDRVLLLSQIIQQNRLFEEAAKRNDATNLARVLRAFETVLLQLAASDTAPQDAEALREQLAFELKIILTKLENESSKETHST